jgi:cyclohexa-1,5-dienecarbonyl-CoA hydratase
MVMRLAVEISPAVARIALRNPPLNIIDIPMMEELGRVLEEIERRADLSVIVLGGSGANFSVGVEVGAHVSEKVQTMLAKFHAVIRALVSTKKVTVAVVQGHCLGGGAELAMVCDLAFTTQNAQWGFPEIKLGCYPPVAAAALAGVVGQKHAANLILTGRTITGVDAAVIGLATRAVPEEQLDAVVADSLDHLTDLSATALAVAKKAIYVWDSVHFDKGLVRAEKIYLDELLKTEDAQEGVNAFLEKRRPVWKNK